MNWPERHFQSGELMRFRSLKLQKQGWQNLTMRQPNESEELQ